MEKRDSLGRSSGFLFEPVTDVLNIAPEYVGRLLHVGSQKKHHRTHTGHRQHEICQSHNNSEGFHHSGKK
ncbi:hypothetical protein HN51_040363 [Arachis hypogaea]